MVFSEILLLEDTSCKPLNTERPFVTPFLTHRLLTMSSSVGIPLPLWVVNLARSLLRWLQVCCGSSLQNTCTLAFLLFVCFLKIFIYFGCARSQLRHTGSSLHHVGSFRCGLRTIEENAAICSQDSYQYIPSLSCLRPQLNVF